MPFPMILRQCIWFQSLFHSWWAPLCDNCFLNTRKLWNLHSTKLSPPEIYCLLIRRINRQYISTGTYTSALKSTCIYALLFSKAVHIYMRFLMHLLIRYKNATKWSHIEMFATSSHIGPGRGFLQAMETKLRYVRSNIWKPCDCTK